MSLAAICVELGEPAPVEILKVGVSAGESQVDIVEHSGVVRARLVRRTRHQALRKRRNRDGIVVIEEGSMFSAAWMLMSGRWTLRLLMFHLGVQFGYESRTRDGARANCRANQECPASCIMLGHADSSPRVLKPELPENNRTCVNNSNFLQQCHRR